MKDADLWGCWSVETGCGMRLEGCVFGAANGEVVVGGLGSGGVGKNGVGNGVEGSGMWWRGGGMGRGIKGGGVGSQRTGMLCYGGRGVDGSNWGEIFPVASLGYVVPYGT